MNKKALTHVGFVITIMAVFLLLGAIFLEDSDKSNVNRGINSEFNDQIQNLNYLFYINNTDIGRQQKITQNFPNIEIGSKIEYNTIHLGNNYRLNANMFSKNTYNIEFEIDNSYEIDEYLLYFSVDRISGGEDILVNYQNNTVARIQGKSIDIPVRILNKNKNQSNISIQMEINKPAFYEIFNWNKIDIYDVKVIGVSSNKDNNIKEFDFALDMQDLENVYVDLVISCDSFDDKISPSIKVLVNDYIVSDQNPNCLSRYNRETIKLPLNALNSEKNRLSFESNGYYKIAYSLNKIYFNDKQSYLFNLNSFDDIVDVVIYGDFDKEVIDLKLNQQTFTLNRGEVISILPYLRYGTNEIKILNKPVLIKELIIEKNEFYQ